MMMNALLFWLDSTRPRTNVQCLLGQKETSSKIVLSVEHVSSISIYTVRVNDGFAMERVTFPWLVCMTCSLEQELLISWDSVKSKFSALGDDWLLGPWFWQSLYIFIILHLIICWNKTPAWPRVVQSFSSTSISWVFVDKLYFYIFPLPGIRIAMVSKPTQWWGCLEISDYFIIPGTLWWLRYFESTPDLLSEHQVQCPPWSQSTWNCLLHVRKSLKLQNWLFVYLSFG